MTAARARRVEPFDPQRRAARTTPRRVSAGRPRLNAERRRRERHFRRRRRDLLEDTGLALLLTIVLLSVTAGLGVLALLDVPIALALLGSVIAERRVSRRGARDAHRVKRTRG